MLTLGSDVLLDSKRLAGARVGIVCNPASIDGRFRHIVDRLAGAEDVTLAAIFGPQHGFRSDVQDNMIETPHGQDAVRRVPIYSLYSETREPTAEMLKGLDTLVVDLQDIGARIYTYIYTLANCLRAARRHGVPIIVCDRPNPIGGDDVEGALLRPGFESFVGQFPIPMRHGLTIGEIARL
ncbi:MAG: exo-beta-N-acetylmuramidase NamZ domain-containing protein, partial [Vicinamibacterales bacterium]